MTRTDGHVVPYTNGAINAPNANNFVVQDRCAQDHTDHSTMAADPIVARDVLYALDPANAKPVPCTPVSPFIGAPLFSDDL
jgi:triacylglycerol lipase